MNTSTVSRDECITAMLEEVRPITLNFARKFNLDYDDCYQHASLLMLEVWPKIPAGYNVKAYLNATVRRGLHKLLGHDIDTLSLDEARTESGWTFLDTLQAHEQKRTEDELDYLEKVTEVVHSALRECRLEEQEYACMAFELPDYTPVPPANQRANYPNKRDKPRRKNNMRESVKYAFRKHPQVQALIQRETCVL